MEAGLPTTLSEWVSLVVQLVVVVGAVFGLLWRFLKQPIEQQINGLGARMEHKHADLEERIKESESGCTHHGTLIDKHDRAVERLENAVALDRERIGRIEGALERLVTATEFNRTAHMEADSEIRERLVRIETKVDALQQSNPPHRRHP